MLEMLLSLDLVCRIPKYLMRSEPKDIKDRLTAFKLNKIWYNKKRVCVYQYTCARKEAALDFDYM